MSRISYNLATVPSNFTVTYTTDNPGITPDGALVIADGDDATVTRAEYNNLAEECEYKFNQILTYLRTVATA
jgi:hypothetical protein